MDDVVRKPRMLGLLREQLFQNGTRLELLAVRFVGWKRRLGNSQRVERRGFGVLRVSAVYMLHRPLVREHARSLIDGAVRFVQFVHRRDVVALARRGCPGGPGALSGDGAVDQRVRRANAGKRILPVRERDPPVCHGARGILREHRLEPLFRG
jgi:hypothetical protein